MTQIIKSNESELKPCPFCGSDDVEIVRQDWEEDETSHHNTVNCNHCGATVSFAVCECTRGYESISADETVRMWNTRAE